MEIALAAVVGVLGGFIGGALGTVLFSRHTTRDKDVDELVTTVGRIAKEFRRIRMRDVRLAAEPGPDLDPNLPLPTAQLTAQQLKEQLRKQVWRMRDVTQKSVP